MMNSRVIGRSCAWLVRTQHCAIIRRSFLVVVFCGLVAQILYDQHLVTVVSLFPQWLLLGAICYAWRRDAAAHGHRGGGTTIFALLIPTLSCLTLLMAWLGWKANSPVIGGVVPVSDSAGHYISAQTFLRDSLLDAEAQRRPLNAVMTSLWLYLSRDNFKLLLVLQALGFSVAAFLASMAASALHGFRAGLLLFALLLVFAEPYLPTTLSETNGIIFGILALVCFLFGLHRRSFPSFCLGALLLSMGLAIRPSALFVLPCVAISGSVIFGSSRLKRLAVAACLVGVILIPSGLSFSLNRAMSHHDGAFNANLSYVVYGLVSGGSGWEQFGRDNPNALVNLPEAEQSRVILQASWQRFAKHPFDLVEGLVKGQLLGPLQTIAQIVRLAFLGASGDPLRIIPSAAIIVISLCFVGVLSCQLSWRTRAPSGEGNSHLFWILFGIGYLASIPMFYKDGGLRLHAAVIPELAYFLVRLLLPSGSAPERPLSDDRANRLWAATAAFSFVLFAALGWICLIHPRSHEFERFPVSGSMGDDKTVFIFKPGWPECDLGKFEHVPADAKPRWFSGAVPDDRYRSAGIREISGEGHLYFGFDAGARDWKIIHAEQSIGLLNEVELGSRGHDGTYRDYYKLKAVRAMDSDSMRRIIGNR
jgi:hypothetical protein